MRSTTTLRAFSMIELMISIALLSVVTISAMGIMNRMQRKQTEATLLGQYAILGQQLDNQFSYDLKNATKIDGTYTNAGTQFNSTATYGILRSPFSDPNNSISDKIQIFVTDTGLSQSTAFDVTAISGTSGSVTFTVSGDFTPVSTLSEDLFVVVLDSKKELFEVTPGSIQVTGTSPSQVSTFSVTGCDSHVCTAIQSSLGSNPPQIYRVQRVTYEIGNGVSTIGLYRTVNGQTEKIASDIASMQIRYELSTTDTARSSDCSTKSGSRWFAHPTSPTTECNWNDIVSIHLELIFESPHDLGAASNFNPHNPSVIDGKVRYAVHISKVPTSYSTNS